MFLLLCCILYLREIFKLKPPEAYIRKTVVFLFTQRNNRGFPQQIARKRLIEAVEPNTRTRLVKDHKFTELHLI